VEDIGLSGRELHCVPKKTSLTFLIVT